MDTKTLLASLATEQVNSRSERLDQMTSLEIATLMNDVTADVTAGIEKALPQIAAETRDLVERAKNGRLKPEEYSGGTFSISNLGMFGIENFTAIINPPEAAILSISSISIDAVRSSKSRYFRIRLMKRLAGYAVFFCFSSSAWSFLISSSKAVSSASY